MDSSTVRERARIAGLKVSAGNAGGKDWYRIAIRDPVGTSLGYALVQNGELAGIHWAVTRTRSNYQSEMAFHMYAMEVALEHNKVLTREEYDDQCREVQWEVHADIAEKKAWRKANPIGKGRGKIVGRNPVTLLDERLRITKTYL